MSTTTDDSRDSAFTTHDRRDSLSAGSHASGKNIQNWLCALLVFVAGASSLATEMAASRLLAPYLGSSLFVWANLIGLILLYLTIGYYVGGRLADHRPSPWILYSLTAVAALLIGSIPLIAQPVLTWALHTFATGENRYGTLYASFCAIILLFTLPTILLGCVSPYAIRLSIDQLGQTGRIAGRLYALSTAGSIVGTFVPVLILLPDNGTNFTFISNAVLLLFISVLALIVTKFTAQKK
jgi:predicted membrane-bound spermidine synthase